MKKSLLYFLWIVASWFIAQFISMGIATLMNITWREPEKLGYIVIITWLILALLPAFFGRSKKKEKADGKTIW